MQAIGDTLREARMRQKVDITEIEARTKIRAKYLRALENEEFDLLPGSTFVKSFLRTYAEALGLDPHLLVEEYRAQYEPRPEADLQPFAATPHTGRRGGDYDRRPPPRRAAIAGLAVVAVLGLLLVIGLTGGSSDKGKKPAASTQPAKKKPARHKKRVRRTAAAPNRVVLKVSPSEATYVCLDTGAGTSVLFEGILSAPRSFRGRHLRLNLGKTSARVSVNGRRVPIAPSSSPVGFDVTPHARKPLPSGQRPC